MRYLCLLFLCGCLGNDYTVRPDPDTSSDIQTAAQAAIADWEANVPAKIGMGGTCAIQRQNVDICIHPVGNIPPFAWEPGVLAGVDVGGDIFLSEPIMASDSPQERQRIVAHELGHAMGLLHTGPGTLMYPYESGGSATVTYTDVVQWFTVRGEDVP